MANLNVIKSWFKTGLKPTQQQFWDTWDSFWHKDAIIPANKIENLDSRFDEKADDEAFKAHLTDEAAHSELFQEKADVGHKHDIEEVIGLLEALNGKQETLTPGFGIFIDEDNVISITAHVPYGEFQIFKVEGNDSPYVEPGDLVKGFITPTQFVTAKYNDGELSDPASYTILEQIDL